MKTQWRLLVVDDEEIMRESLAAWLREDGYIVDTASGGREAVELTRKCEYAIHFVDLKMPGGMDGIETMIEIRRLRPEACLIIITAYATVDTAITAIKEGAQEYIVKPCNPEEISMLVSRIIKVKKPAARKHHPTQEADAPIPLSRHHQQECQDARHPGTGAGGGQPAEHGADSGRERHRQGTGGARHS